MDVQSQKDFREIPVDRVGVKDLHYPIVVLDKANKHQSTVARINMYVNLPQDFKGTHMSRFVEVLNQHHGQINIHNFLRLDEKPERQIRAH
jgi:GTP cyclohydrolase I